MGRLLWMIIFLPFISVAQNVQLSGSVTDSTGFSLSSAHIQVIGQKKKFVTSGALGRFSVSVPRGEVRLEVSYTGYKKLECTLIIKGDTSITLILKSKFEQLDEVVVTAERTLQSDQFETTRMSTNVLSGKEISSIPVLGGEADLIKTIQLLPGVSKGADGTTDLFVRGGAADQNLVLLDGAPVYNTGHLFGFLSVFNPDILDKVESINGAFPAQYGGRLSSILDVSSKAGFPNKTHVKGNIGLLATRLMIEQPLVKDKLSVWVAGRRTYVDQVVKAVGQELPYFFYDFNGKLLYRPRADSRLEITFYQGNDVLNFSNVRPSLRNRNFNADFTLGNSTQTLRWDRNYKMVNSTLYFYRTLFNYNIRNTFQDNRLLVASSIEDIGGKWTLSTDSLTKNVSFTTGIEMVRHQVAPNRITTAGEISELLKTGATQPQTAIETNIFVQADGKFAKQGRYSAGMRVSSAYVGKTFYPNLEPRAALRWSLDSVTALKLSYSRMAQYLHRVSSAAVAFPTDIWYPVTGRVRPQTADQVALAVQRTLPRQSLYVSIEGYYKWMHDLIGYKEGASLLLNTNFEDQLVQGKGRAYGLEVLIKKETGKLTGWISYTWSKAERQFDLVNGGQRFLARYDRRHNAAVVMNYQFAKRWAVSTVFEFISGSRFTPIVGQYVVPSPTLVGVDLIPVYAPINSVKLADTHRLDVGIKFRSRPERTFQGEWFAGVYNVYNRAAPVGVVIVPNGDGSFRYEQPGLFGLLPFISYGFKF
ncbi:MAG: TonB-dependent receptor plug domain-containing protein [Cyclobacteriaceae bacterium]|nr:TonB-dependent receptor plug domain-containing protein [Cyclobacteriaceae bacterium]